MRYIIELPVSKVQAIKSLIDNKKYGSIQSFILTAIENQLYLEKQPAENLISAQIENRSTEEKYDKYSLGSLVSKPPSELSGVVTVKEPQPSALSAETLWALYNRVFPVKISLRVLLNMLKSNPTEDGYINLWSVQDSATAEARQLRRKLIRIDKKTRRGHGEKLSTGLPRKGNRSRDRFKVHFVGSINSKEHIEGAPAILRFVNMRKDEQGQPQIGITDSGLHFALMENPVLDRADYTQALSEEESEFYLRQISEKLPKEYALSVRVLKAIGEGCNTPKELTEVIAREVSPIKEREAQAVGSSLISRLSELGLLTRQRIGLKVTYMLTTKARNVLANQEIHNIKGADFSYD